MSLTKLLMAPIKLFKKDVITFLIIRRHDLGIMNDNLSYIAVRPSASISVLRQKVWHLLELPDYCEEIIILKSPTGVELPLTELRRGNDPQKPYILEVWSPENQLKMNCEPTLSSETVALNKLRVQTSIIYEGKKSDLSCKLSRSSIFKLNGRKSQDNFTNLLLKIQNDLSTLSNKLSVIENKIAL